jgi:hypothetical protein
MNEFDVGQRVLWRGGFGMNAPRIATIVDNTGEKNDQRVYDLDNGHWAYGDQLEPLPASP